MISRSLDKHRKTKKVLYFIIGSGLKYSVKLRRQFLNMECIYA